MEMERLMCIKVVRNGCCTYYMKVVPTLCLLYADAASTSYASDFFGVKWSHMWSKVVALLSIFSYSFMQCNCNANIISEQPPNPTQRLKLTRKEGHFTCTPTIGSQQSYACWMTIDG
jgi:hypothetical protein